MRLEIRLFWLSLALSLVLNALGLGAFCLMLQAYAGVKTRAFELVAYGDGGDGLPVGAAAMEGDGVNHDPLLDHDIHTERAVPVLPTDIATVMDEPQLLPDVLPEPAPVPKPRTGGSGTATTSATSGTGGGGRGGTPGSRTGVRGLDSSPPAYPEAARQQGIQGRVVVHISISAEGLVVDAKIHTSSGFALLDDAALRHARTRRFSPARDGGVPVATTALYPVNFSLTDRR